MVYLYYPGRGFRPSGYSIKCIMETIRFMMAVISATMATRAV